MTIPPPKPINFVPLHILVVDDNEEERLNSVNIIKANNHMVQAVDSGQAAVTAAYETPFDVILMDLVMPGLDGFAATKLIRSLPATRGWVPILALTSTENPEDVRQCFQVGMSNFILKPLTNSKLIAALSTYAYRKSMQMS